MGNRTAAQESFLDSRSQNHFGRNELIKKVETYCFSDSSRLPLLVVGESGAGKSSVIAKCAKNAQFYANNDLLNVADGCKRWKVFYHFVGATPGSTDLAFILHCLMKEINPDAKETIADVSGLVRHTNNILSNDASDPMLVFIDAVNQIDDDKQYLLDQWLPNKLSPNIKVVLSTIEGTKSHILLRSYKPPLKELVCGPLDDTSKIELVLSIFKTLNKKLEKDQLCSLVAKRGSNNPLWLTFACEELGACETFENVFQKIQELPDDLISIEMTMFARLENKSGGLSMKSALCLLEVSRHGLLENELMALLETLEYISPGENSDSLNSKQNSEAAKNILVREEVNGSSTNPGKLNTRSKYVNRLPARNWAVIYRNLRPLLRPCGDLSEGRLDFYHRSLSKAVRQKYFNGSDRIKKRNYSYWHGVLVDYFESVTSTERRAEELPYQLAKIQDSNRLAKCLLEWPIFNRLFDEYFSIDLLQFWQKGSGLVIATELYMKSLTSLKQSGANDNEFCDQAQKVAIFLVQAGKYEESYQILANCVSLEMNDPPKIADAYASMAYCKTIHLNTKELDMSDQDKVKERKKIVELCRMSNTYRGQHKSKEQDYKMAKNNIELSYNLFRTYDKEKALAVINEAITIFEMFNDIGMLARSYHSKSFSVLDVEDKKADLMRARKLCLKAYGESHELYGDICYGMGDMYRNNDEYDSAYDWYVESKNVYSKLYGESHPETKQVKGTLQHESFNDIRQQRERLAPGIA